MAHISLAHQWKEQLVKNGWDNSTASLVPYSLAKSTVSLYDKYLNLLYVFCQYKNLQFPPNDQSVITSFMCELAKKSVPNLF